MVKLKEIDAADDQVFDINNPRIEAEIFNQLTGAAQLRYLIPIIANCTRLHEYWWVGDEKGMFTKHINGMYKDGVSQSLNKLIRRYYKKVGFDILKKTIDEVRQYLKESYRIPPEDFDYDYAWINFHNGLMPLFGDKAWTLLPHDPDHKSLVQIPHDYIIGSKCPKFDGFIDMVCSVSDRPEWMKRMLWEIIGYCMQYSVRMKKAFLIISKDTNTGKSTYVNILTGVLGDENTSKIHLNKLTNPNFGAGAAAHKLLNYYDDLPRYIKVENIDIWKSQIDGKKFNYEKKYKDETKHWNILKQVYPSNALPKMAWDLTITERLVILFFNHKIQNKDIVRGWEFINILYNKKEMEGIVYNAVLALKRLFERGHFEASTDKEILEIVLTETDIIYKFITECCNRGTLPDSNPEDPMVKRWYTIRKITLFGLFEKFQELEGDSAKIDKRIFTKALKKYGYPLKQFKFPKKMGDSIDEISRAYKDEDSTMIYLGLDFKGYPKRFSEVKI